MFKEVSRPLFPDLEALGWGDDIHEKLNRNERQGGTNYTESKVVGVLSL